MKKFAPLLVFSFLLIALALNGCTRTQSTQPAVSEASPTAGVVTLLPEAIASQTAAPTAAPPTAAPPTATAPPPTKAPTATPTAVPPTPTATLVTALTLVPKGQPTSFPSPTVTPQGAPFDPYLVYGNPNFSDPMDGNSHGNWVSGGVLPNTEYIQISLQDDQLYVTGKRPGFSTWFFSWPTLTDFYIQMKVKSEACSGKDEYGLIVRGPAHKAGVSYGYIVAFTCDGFYRVTRLDSASPAYASVDLVPLTQSDRIHAGADKKNIIGIRAEGSKFTIFANGYFLTEFSDNTYPQGRYGVFVQAVDSYAGYTYRPMEIVY